jgi:acyl-[acyl-carrier-protein] desaturase
MKNIAADENHHFIFYKGVMQALLDESPSTALEGIYRAFANFQMPGIAMPNFLRRSIAVAKAGVYNLRIHHDRVIAPLIRDWKIADLSDLKPAAAELQERIMAIPGQLIEQAERFEKRVGIGYA